MKKICLIKIFFILFLFLLTSILLSGCIIQENSNKKSLGWAVDDNKIIFENSINNIIDVLLNDNEDNGEGLTIDSLFVEPINGSASISENKILYTPADDFVGSDYIRYKVVDKYGNVDIATVEIKIYSNDGESFEFYLLDGSKVNIAKYRGKIVLIDFFGVYCQPCQYQMLELKQIYDEYKNKNVEIISIDVWIAAGETPELVESFISTYKQENIDLDWVFGVDDSSGTLLNKYANSGVPMLYLLDENGNIYYSKASYTEYSILADKLDDLLNN